MNERNSWTNCERWLDVIYEESHHHPAFQHDYFHIELAKDGFVPAKEFQPIPSHSQITEADYERVIKQAAIDIPTVFKQSQYRFSKDFLSSYYLKHKLEEQKGYYITNGEFILAVLISDLGFTQTDWCWLLNGLEGRKRKQPRVLPNIVFPLVLLPPSSLQV